MKVDFFDRRATHPRTGDEVIAYWASTDFGEHPADSGLNRSRVNRIKDRTTILKEELITSIDLFDLEPDLAQTIIDTQYRMCWNIPRSRASKSKGRGKAFGALCPRE